MRRTLILSLTALAVLAAPAKAENSSSWVQLGDQWVALNRCDAASHTVGVRASQAGDAKGRRMYTRFSYQWLNGQTGAWESVPGAGSGWLDAGAGPWLARETGWNQVFDPAPAGTTFRIRGVVEMQWRSGGAVAKSTTLTSPQACDLH